jgi:hypothetical protein
LISGDTACLRAIVEVFETEAETGSLKTPPSRRVFGSAETAVSARPATKRVKTMIHKTRELIRRKKKRYKKVKDSTKEGKSSAKDEE